MRNVNQIANYENTIGINCGEKRDYAQSAFACHSDGRMMRPDITMLPNRGVWGASFPIALWNACWLITCLRHFQGANWASVLAQMGEPIPPNNTTTNACMQLQTKILASRLEFTNEFDKRRKADAADKAARKARRAEHKLATLAVGRPKIESCLPPGKLEETAARYAVEFAKMDKACKH